MKKIASILLLPVALFACSESTGSKGPSAFTAKPIRAGEYEATLVGKPGTGKQELKREFDREGAKLCGTEKTYLLRGLREDAHMKPGAVPEPVKTYQPKAEPAPDSLPSQKAAKGKKGKNKKVVVKKTVVPAPVIAEPPIDPAKVDYYVLKGRVGCVGADYFQ